MILKASLFGVIKVGIVWNGLNVFGSVHHLSLNYPLFSNQNKKTNIIKLEGCPGTTCGASTTLTFDLPIWSLQMANLPMMENNCANLHWNPSTTGGVTGLDKHLTFKCDLDLGPSWTNVSNGTSTGDGEQMCQIILKFMHNLISYGPEKFGRTHIHQTHVETTMPRSLPAGSTKIFETPTLIDISDIYKTSTSFLSVLSIHWKGRWINKKYLCKQKYTYIIRNCSCT